jgi:hypothetical protein
MELTRTERGFPVLLHKGIGGDTIRLLQMSSVVGPYEDAFERPGTSALWVGWRHHLSREEVAQLVRHMQHWLDAGTIELPKEGVPGERSRHGESPAETPASAKRWPRCLQWLRRAK